MERRDALQGAGTVALAVLAGCLAEGGAGDTPTDEDGGDGTPTATPAMTDRSFEVTGTASGAETQVATVAWDDGVTITGTTTGKTGCHTAVLKAVSYEHPKLAVTVASKKPADAGVCTQVITTIDYEATFSFAGPGPERVVVTHDSMGKTRTVATAERP